MRYVPNPDWHGKRAVPADCFADLAIEGVTSQTSPPPEVAFGAAMAMISARLIANGSVVRIDADHTVDPTLWLVILALSGSAKTFGADRVLDIGRPVYFEDPSSSAGYFEALRSGKNRTLWFRDEFGQLLKYLKDPSSPTLAT